MDIMGGEDFFGNNFEFNQTPPLNAAFELFGIGDKNFIMNSASYFLIQVFMLANYFGKLVIIWLATKFAQNKYARLVGIYFYEPNKDIRLKNAYLKLFLESYFDICFCAMLNSIAFKESNDHGELSLHFSTLSNISCSVITIFYDFALLTFPVYGYLVVKKNFETLETTKTIEKYGIFTEGMRVRNMHQALYNIYFMSRRFITALVLIFLAPFPFFQCQFLLVMSTVNFIYLVAV